MRQKVYNHSQIARDVFDLATSIVGYDVTRMCFEASQEELNKTLYCQICTLTVELALLGLLPLESRSIGNITGKIMKVAGIRQSPGMRKGTHIFRHHVASALLGNGIPQPVISRTLGHTAPDSLEPYLRADFIHLKECALDVSGFPVAEEVFGNG